MEKEVLKLCYQQFEDFLNLNFKNLSKEEMLKEENIVLNAIHIFNGINEIIDFNERESTRDFKREKKIEEKILINLLEILKLKNEMYRNRRRKCLILLNHLNR